MMACLAKATKFSAATNRGMPVQSSASSSKAKGAAANFEVRMAAPALQEDLPETIRKGS